MLIEKTITYRYEVEDGTLLEDFSSDGLVPVDVKEDVREISTLRFRALDGRYTLYDARKLYENDTQGLVIPTQDDTFDIRKILEKEGITEGMVLLKYVEQAMFVPVYNVKLGEYDIMNSRYHEFILLG